MEIQYFWMILNEIYLVIFSDEMTFQEADMLFYIHFDDILPGVSIFWAI